MGKTQSINEGIVKLKPGYEVLVLQVTMCPKEDARFRKCIEHVIRPTTLQSVYSCESLMPGWDLGGVEWGIDIDKAIMLGLNLAFLLNIYRYVSMS